MNYEAEQVKIRETIEKLQKKKNEAIEAEANRKHYLERKQQLLNQLKNIGIDVNDLEYAEKALIERKAVLEKEIREMIPEEIENGNWQAVPKIRDWIQ